MCCVEMFAGSEAYYFLNRPVNVHHLSNQGFLVSGTRAQSSQLHWPRLYTNRERDGSKFLDVWNGNVPNGGLGRSQSAIDQLDNRSLAL